jgi:2'-5' RNA ligase
MPDNADTVRMFVAIPLPDPVKGFLADIQTELKSAGLIAAWPAPDNFHLTLKFLGPIPQNKLRSIQSVMPELSGAYPDLSLMVKGMGVFPNVKNARIVWSGIQGQTRQLNRLVTDLDTVLQTIGIPGQSRPFFPHITLARIRKPVSVRMMMPLIRRFENNASVDFPVNHLVFYKSRLTSQGAIHSSLFQISVSRFR